MRCIRFVCQEKKKEKRRKRIERRNSTRRPNGSCSDTETVEGNRTKDTSIRKSSSYSARSFFKRFSYANYTLTVSFLRCKAVNWKIWKKRNYNILMALTVSLRRSWVTMIYVIICYAIKRSRSFIRLLRVLMIGSHYSSLLTFTRTRTRSILMDRHN